MTATTTLELPHVRIPVERLEVIPHARFCVPCSARPADFLR